MPKYNRFIRPIVLLVMISILFLAISPVFAAGITVDTTTDLIDANGGSCIGMTIAALPGADGLTSLREAICAANGTAGADVITIPAGTYTLDSGNGHLSIVSDLTLNGAGIDQTIIQADGCNPTSSSCAHSHGAFLISNSGTDASINNLNIRHGNAAGGGIYILGGTTTLDLDSVAIVDNASPDHGAGIFNLGAAIGTISNSHFENNVAQFFGGAIYNEGSTIDNIDYSNFYDNHAVLDGGGIYSRFGGGISSISSSEFIGNSAQFGGAIGLSGSDIGIIDETDIGFNSASKGGGIYLENSAEISTITETTFSDNSGLSYGGGIAIMSGTISGIDHNTFSGNYSDSGLGGGIYNDSSGTIGYISFTSFLGNEANYGGGIYNWEGIIGYIDYSTFSGNDALYNGGGISTNGPISSIVNSTFTGNSADEGGGIYDDGLVMGISNSTISGNTAGSGLYLDSNSDTGTITVQNSIISGNTGGDCIIDGGVTLTADSSNLDSDGSCDSAVQKTNAEINLSPLADNGGPTQTMALLAGSHAIDTGNSTTCTNIGNKDQRGVTRPLDGDSTPGAVCDIGAFEYTADESAPLVVSSLLADANPTSAASVDFTVTFSKSVTGVDSADFSLTTTGSVSGASVTGAAGGGDSYTVTVDTGTGEGTIRLDVLDDDSIVDGVGLSMIGGYTSGEFYTIDTAPPTVVSSLRLDANPTSAASVDFAVTFSKPVTGVDPTDFDLSTTGGVSGAAVTGVAGGGDSYTVTVDTGTGEGTIRLDVLDDDSIIDGGSLPLDGGFFGGETYSILLFEDDFETGNFNNWTRVNTGNGYLYPCTDAAINGSFGACVDRGTDKRKQLIDETPVDQTSFSARFNIDINSLSMAEGTRFRFAQVKMGAQRPFFIVLRYLGGKYHIQLNTLQDDLTKIKTGWYPLSDAPHTIEVDWEAASSDGANDGWVKLYLDDALLQTLGSLDNDTIFVYSFKLGFTSRLTGKLISGIFYLDDVATSNTGHIGLP